MIHACFQEQQQSLVGVSICGHAAYADAGQDIVCAGVSSTVAENEIQIQLPSSARTQNAVRILNGLLLELQQIQAEFPDYLEIEHMEVSTSC